MPLHLASIPATKIFYTKNSLWQDMSRPVTVQYVVPFSISFLVAGLVLTGLSLYDLIEEADLFGLGGWWFYILIIGIIMALVGFFYLYAYLNRIKKFKKLIAEKSKKEFVTNLDELEYTAWRLPKSYEDKVAEKKKEFGVK